MLILKFDPPKVDPNSKPYLIGRSLNLKQKLILKIDPNSNLYP
jgi:hypothetical protein